jgi:hypothetical protein
MQATHAIRQLVEKALYIKQLTPDIENEINYELTRLGYISDIDYEALELLMDEMDAGRVQLVSSDQSTSKNKKILARRAIEEC